MKNSILILFAILMTNISLAQTESTDQDIQTSELRFKRNKVTLNYGEVLVERLGISFEHMLRNEKIAIKVPFSISYDNDSFNDPIWQTGVDLLYYPVGNKKVSYFTGIGTRFGEMGTRPQYILFGSNYSENRIISSYGAVYVQNGLVINMTDQFSINAMFGMGTRATEFNNLGDPHFIGEFGASFRF